MYAAHLYDAVFLYATALGATLRENNITDPAEIMEAAKDGKSLFKRIIADRKYDSQSILLSDTFSYLLFVSFHSSLDSHRFEICFGKVWSAPSFYHVFRSRDNIFRDCITQISCLN